MDCQQLSKQTVQSAERDLGRSCNVMGWLIALHGPCLLADHEFQPFRTLATAIISQQLSAKAADTIRNRVQGVVPSFAPAGFLAVGLEELCAAGLSFAKAGCIVELAQRVRDGEINFEAIQKCQIARGERSSAAATRNRACRRPRLSPPTPQNRSTAVGQRRPPRVVGSVPLVTARSPLPIQAGSWQDAIAPTGPAGSTALRSRQGCQRVSLARRCAPSYRTLLHWRSDVRNSPAPNVTTRCGVPPDGTVILPSPRSGHRT